MYSSLRSGLMRLLFLVVAATAFPGIVRADVLFTAFSSFVYCPDDPYSTPYRYSHAAPDCSYLIEVGSTAGLSKLVPLNTFGMNVYFYSPSIHSSPGTNVDDLDLLQGTLTFDSLADPVNVLWLVVDPSPAVLRLEGTDQLGAVNTWELDFARVPFSSSLRIPEPATLSLLGLGFAGLAASRRRKQ